MSTVRLIGSIILLQFIGEFCSPEVFFGMVGLIFDRTYYYYFWTSYTPYTVKTVTSTRTTTKTVWSVYATNSLDARSELRSSSRSYTFSAPYSATSLKSSTKPVTISASSAAPTSTSSNTGDTSGRLVSGSGDPGVFPDSAVGRGVSSTGVIAAVLVAAIGGLAFGL